MIKQFIYYTLLCFMPALVDAQTQTQTKSKDKDGKFVLGIERRADEFCQNEFHVKYLKRFCSFSLKYAMFDYNDRHGYVGLSYKYAFLANTRHVGEYNYHVKGFALKPGWIFWHYLHKYLILSSTGSVVITSSNHQFDMSYLNQYSSNKVHDYAVGLEYEFLFGFRIVDNFLLSGAVQFGGKPKQTFLFNDVVPGFPPVYEEYGPAQGYSEDSRLYVNATLGLSFIF